MDSSSVVAVLCSWKGNTVNWRVWCFFYKIMRFWSPCQSSYKMRLLNKTLNRYVELNFERHKWYSD
jgi:hypothetical protein